MNYNPLNPATIADPFPEYDELRTKSPIFWSQESCSWVLTRYEDCREVLRNHNTFASDLRRIGRHLPDAEVSLQSQDPPHQQKLRHLLISSINLQDLNRICSEGARSLTKILNSIPNNHEIDFMENVSRRIALKITSDLIGITSLDGEMIHSIFISLTRQMDSELDSSRKEEGLEAAAVLEDLMQTWFEQGSKNGVLGALKNCSMPYDSALSQVIYSMCAIFNACYSTLYAFTGSAMLTILTERRVFARHFVKKNVNLTLAAEELIRYISPAQSTTRHAVHDTFIAGQLIKAGDCVTVLLAAANRDPLQFPNPNVLVLDRKPNHHLGLGWGAHSCIGNQVAQEWIKQFLEFNMVNLNQIEIAGNYEFMHSATLRNLVRLPIIIHSDVV